MGWRARFGWGGGAKRASQTRIDDPVVLAAFRAHGVNGRVEVHDDESGDEAIYFVAPEELSEPQLTALTGELVALLGRKVWIGERSPAWDASRVHRLDDNYDALGESGYPNEDRV